MKKIMIISLLLCLILITGCVVKYEQEKTVKKSSEPPQEADVVEEPMIKEDIVEVTETEYEEGEAIAAGEDVCTGTVDDDSLFCTDGDDDGQVSREAIEMLGEISDSRKTKFFDGNKFFLEIKDKKYKITLREESVDEFRLDAIPEEEVGLCGLEFNYDGEVWTLKFNPGSSHKDWDDVKHCLSDCGVEQDSPDQPDFDQQSCILDCGIAVCQS